MRKLRRYLLKSRRIYNRYLLSPAQEERRRELRFYSRPRHRGKPKLLGSTPGSHPAQSGGRYHGRDVET